MKKTRFLSLVLTILLIFSAFTVCVSAESSISWNYDASTQTLTISGTGSTGDYNLESDTPWYVNADEIKHAVIGEGITVIGESSISGLKALESVSLPSTVKTIGKWAFYDDVALTTINIPDGVELIDKSAFGYCTSLESIIIPSSVKTIGECAFFETTKLANITIQNGLETIGEGAFYECALNEIVIPNSVNKIDDSCFTGCANLKSVTLSTSLSKIGWGMFENCTSLESVVIPDNIITIDEAAFYSCTSLASVKLSANVVSIGKEAFYDTALTNITIPSSAETIDSYAFGYYFARGYMKTPGFTITGEEASQAQTYAAANGFAFTAIIVKNGFINEDNGTRYYENDAYKTGWQTIDDNRYYFDPTTGLMATGIITISGVQHEFAADGKYIGTVIKNGLISEGGAARFYIEDIYQTGWWMVDGYQYYFSLTTGLATIGTKTMSGSTYEFDEEGKLIGEFVKTGFTIEDNGLRYYVNGTYQTGWQVINGKQYFFSLTTGIATTGFKTLSGVEYEFAVDGKMKGTFIKNGFAHEDGGIRYYISGKYQTGWRIINEKRYYFSLTTGLATVGSKTLGGVEYIFAADGKMKGTFVKEGLAHEDGGIRFYINGKYQTGWQIINGKQYFFSLTTGIATVGLKTSGGVEYIFADDGKMQGTFIKNGFANEDGGIRYYVGGKYQTGWRIINNKQYYFSITTGMATTGNKTLSGVDYIFGADGKMSGTFVKNGWAYEDGGIRYYVDGSYRTGWQDIGDKTYYFAPTTGLATIGSKTLGGVIYEFNTDGSLVK